MLKCAVVDSYIGGPYGVYQENLTLLELLELASLVTLAHMLRV